MPDVGMPMPASARPASHTSSQQWQSFEIKMRYRRAERCVLRAQTALEAGMEEEARAALDEARTLNADTPTLESLRAAVRERQAIAAAADRRAKERRLAAVAVLVVALGSGAVWSAFTWLAADDPAGPTEPAGQVASAATGTPDVQSGTSGSPDVQVGQTAPATADPQPGTSDPQADGVAPLAEVKANLTQPGQTGAAATAGFEQAGPAPITVPFSPPTAEQTPMPAVREMDPNARVQQPTTSDALPRTILPSMTFDRLLSGMPNQPVPGPPAPGPPAPEPVVSPRPPAAAAEPAEPKVRAVLAQFESAYSSLDAPAAQAVWPGVDGRSLARAFESLESQRVSLGRCSISLTGTAARADCSGTTTWTPKVGGGTRTEPRRWQFELAASNGAWYIVNAQAR